jgi:DNA-binding phage protein
MSSNEPEQVAHVRELADAGENHWEIANKTGLSATPIRRILADVVVA